MARLAIREAKAEQKGGGGMKMARHRFKDVVFVSFKESGTDNEWMEVNESPIEAIEEDGPTRVATYKLVEVRTLQKNPLPIEIGPRRKGKR